ncbi:MAG TPA: sulfite exporter TauE/SafE family protein, partial [Rubrobacteraceae bacterium]|nr:sulfite exporter TauE/SafE family protein [Rubrobacteraceae bacterium]
TSEFIVALSASVGFLISLTFAQVPWSVVGALLAGGLVAAPIAAWIVRHLNARVLGTAVGGFILLVNAKTFLEAVGLDPSLNVVVYAVILVVWLTALFFAITAVRRERQPVLETEAT